MKTKQKIANLAGLLCLTCGLMTGCGPNTSPPATVAVTTQTESPTASSREFGDYVLHFNAIRTDALTPEIAKTYNIVRSANRALLNISMVKKADGAEGVPVSGSVTAKAVNLNGQFKDLTLREIREGAAIYYIGDVAVANDETLVFTVDATPVNETSRLSVRFQRQFFGG